MRQEVKDFEGIHMYEARQIHKEGYFKLCSELEKL
jgi:hypothetical protein